MPPIITLLTDFGTADNYVGEVKGTLLSRVHGAALFDITHQVPPGDLRAGQYILGRVWHRFPQGTVHLVVVGHDRVARDLVGPLSDGDCARYRHDVVLDIGRLAAGCRMMHLTADG